MHILLGVLLSAVVCFSVVSIPVAAAGVGTWMVTTSYPTTIYEQSCVVSGGYVYCVGGYTESAYSSAVNFGSLSSSGVSTWKSTTSYPTGIAFQSCVVSGGYIYCVGGDTGVSPYVTSAVYFAPLSPGGVGSWTTTTSYPTTIYEQSCVVSGGYIYCIGGYTTSAVTSAVYFAPLSSSGVGSWVKTKSYPKTIYQESCVVSGSYVYCVGGWNGVSVFSVVYFAKLSSAGVGKWVKTTSYPTRIFVQSCVVNGGYIYCIAGWNPASKTGRVNTVYFASLSSGGVGSWVKTTSYPTPINDQSCAVSGSYIYCVGGTFTSAVYFASV